MTPPTSTVNEGGFYSCEAMLWGPSGQGQQPHVWQDKEGRPSCTRGGNVRRRNPGTLLGHLMKKFPEGLLNRLQMSLGGHTLPCHNLNQGRMRQAGTGPVGEGLVSLLCSDSVTHHPKVEFKHAVGLRGPRSRCFLQEADLLKGESGVKSATASVWQQRKGNHTPHE